MCQTSSSAALASSHFGVTMPFMDKLGLHSLHSCTEKTVTLLPYHASLCNSRGDVHGGALMSGLDYTLSAAGRAQAPGYGMATIEMQTQFLSPARGDIHFHAHCLRQVGDTVFCSANAIDQKGRIVATATASLKMVRRLEQ